MAVTVVPIVVPIVATGAAIAVAEEIGSAETVVVEAEIVADVVEMVAAEEIAPTLIQRLQTAIATHQRIAMAMTPTATQREEAEITTSHEIDARDMVRARGGIVHAEREATLLRRSMLECT